MIDNVCWGMCVCVLDIGISVYSTNSMIYEKYIHFLFTDDRTFSKTDHLL